MPHTSATRPLVPRLPLERLVIAVALIGLALLVAAEWRKEAALLPPLQSVGRIEDPSTRLTVGQVAAMPFAPSTGYLAEGYTRSAFWLRLSVDRPSGPSGEVALRVFPPVLDEVSVFQRDATAPSGWKRTDLHARPETALRGVALRIPEGGTELFVRVRSVGSVTAGVKVLARDDAFVSEMRNDVIQIGYLMLMVVLLVWSVRMYVLTRDRLFLAFVLLKAVWITHNLLIFGYLPLFLHLWDGWQYPTLRFVAIINTLAGFLFHRGVIARYDPPRAALLVLDGLLLVSATAMLIFLAYDRSAGLTLNGFTIFLFPFALLLAAGTARKNAGSGLKVLRSVYLVFCCTLFLWIFTLLGFGNAQASDRYSIILHGLSTGLLMFVLLRLHGKGLLAVLRQAEEALMSAETLRQAERRHAELRLRFIDMLAHETRNALAVISMSVAAPVFADRQRRRVQDTIADLDRIIERSAQWAVMQHDGGAPAARAGVDLVALLKAVRNVSGDPERVHLETPPHLHVESDPVLLKVVLVNLVENAVKYSDRGTVVSVGVSAAQGQVSIVVSNAATEYGVPDPERVFDKCYRGERAQAHFGSGMGLGIARHLARVLDGALRYEPGKGAVRFVLDLPC